jgi:hypothetical protein
MGVSTAAGSTVATRTPLPRSSCRRDPLSPRSANFAIVYALP